MLRLDKKKSLLKQEFYKLLYFFGTYLGDMLACNKLVMFLTPTKSYYS